MCLELSRPKLAKKVGCHPNSIVNIENSGRSARLELASKLAEAMCCLVDDFIRMPTPKRLKEIHRAYFTRIAQSEPEEAGAA